MNNPFFQSADWKLNRLVNAGLDVFAPGFPATDIFGQVGFTGDTHVLPRHIAVCEDDVTGAWIYIAAINKGEIVTARWTLAPGGLSVPPPTSGTTGQYKPFGVDGEAELPAPNKLAPDAAGFLLNHIENLNSDLVDGFHASQTGTASTVGVRQSNSNLTVATTPVAGTDAASKAYVDGKISEASRGIRPRTFVRLMSLGNIAGTYSGTSTATILGSGTLTIDGRTGDLNDRVALNGQTTKIQNGVYKVTQANPFILTREPGATDPDGKGAYATGDYFPVVDGTTQKGSAWVIDTLPPLTTGTPIVWGTHDVQFNLYDAAVAIETGLGLKQVAGVTHFKNDSYAALDQQVPFFDAAGVLENAVGNFKLFENKAAATALTGYRYRIPFGWARNKSELSSGEPALKNGPAVFAELDAPTRSWALRPVLTTDDGLALEYLLQLGASGNASSIAKAFIVPSGDTNQPTHVGVWKLNDTEVNRVHGIPLSNFAGYLTPSLDTLYVPKTRTLTLTGDAYIQVTPDTATDLSVNRSWVISLKANPPNPPWIPPSALGTLDVIPAWAASGGTALKNSIFRQNLGPPSRIEPISTEADIGLGSASNWWGSLYAGLTDASGTHFTQWVAGQLVKRPFDLVRDDLGVTAGTTNVLPRWSAANKLVDSAITDSGTNLFLNRTTQIGGRLAVNTGAVPLGQIDLAAGSTALAPIRLHGTGNALLTTPAAGAVESDNTRLWFTDSTPVRHGSAHIDDIGFTNDPSAAPGGAVAYNGATSTTTTSILAGGVTHPVSIFARWAEADVLNMAYSVFYTTRTAAPQSLFGVGIAANGQVTVNFYDPAGSFRGALSVPNFRSRFLSGGRICDVCLVKSASAISLYANGVLVGTSSPAYIGDPVGMDSAGWFGAGASFSGQGYAARIFNRALSAADVARLSRNGVEVQDQWGTFAAIYTSTFAAGTDGWATVTGSVITGNVDTIAGEDDWLRIDRTDTGGYSAGRTMAPALKRLRITGRAFVPGGSPHAWIAASSAGVSPPGFGSAATTPGTAINFAIEGASNSATAVLYMGGTTASNLAASSNASANPLYLKSLVLYGIGAVVDVDFGWGCGATLPDRSGRYPTAISGTGWTHLISTCPTTVGPIQTPVRKYTETLTSVVQQTDRTVTHGLGVESVVVEVWNGASPRQRVDVGVQKVSGNESNALTLSFGLFGSTQNMLAVVIG